MQGNTGRGVGRGRRTCSDGNGVVVVVSLPLCGVCVPGK